MHRKVNPPISVPYKTLPMKPMLGACMLYYVTFAPALIYNMYARNSEFYFNGNLQVFTKTLI